MKPWMRRTAATILVLGILGTAVAWYLRDAGDPAPAFRTAGVKRDDLVVTIAATGTVEPEEVVDVGAQVAGQILSFGTDKSGKPVDYGSVIEAGMVLARIDDMVRTRFAPGIRMRQEQGPPLAMGLLLPKNV